MSFEDVVYSLVTPYKNNCSLCSLEKKTHWYFENEFYIVCDCLKCKVPMFVWKSHKFPAQDQIDWMIREANLMFPNRTIDVSRKSVLDHYHFHCR